MIFDDTDPESRVAALAAFDAITPKALDLGGTITGEHGTGRLKRAWLARELDPTSCAVQTAIKAALDPDNLLNPAVAW